MQAWEVKQDGTMNPVTVTGRSLWPGAVKITREDGSHATVYANTLVNSKGQRVAC